MAHYEIEIKSLLGEAANAEALKVAMAKRDTAFLHTSSNAQLNHYFAGGNMEELVRVVTPLFAPDRLSKLHMIAQKGQDFSVRTRQRDDEVLLVVKASVDAGTSENTIARLEFEEAVDSTLEELDAQVQTAGFTYQAKWSREREEYAYNGLNVSIDYNAGYGYLAEFEKIVTDEVDVPAAKAEIEAQMQALGVKELDQARLGRMFEHYNVHWRDYYGTTNTFVVE